MSRFKSLSGKRDDQVYDKHAEHVDQSPLGKLQQQYWTTKQQVIQKLGKKEDEFVVLSDAELDAKLDLFEAIEQSSIDLLRVIEIYQEKLLSLSIEESEMSTFLKSESTYDTKTKAGKIMAAVSKAQHFAAQQRNSLRLPLVRLYNEVETFRLRAIADTFLTVRKMENARVEYRGALLWMRDVSSELDPDATRKLEKFRRVQAQVKKTKTKFDRLKTDVTQKVDMLSASRCNMFSHVLVNYQRTLILFWQKTAKTFGAVAETFKGYQHYEFNIIKDLVEPSKRLAEICNTVKKEETDDELILEKSKNDSTLIDFEEQPGTEFKEEEKSVDQVNELIDLMTLNEAGSLNEQLKELEMLEQEKMKRISSKASNENNKFINSILNISKSSDEFSSRNHKTSSDFGSKADTNNLLDFGETQMSNIFNFKDLLNNTNNEFETEWNSAFTASNNNAALQSPIVQNQEEFNFFSQANCQQSSKKYDDINLFDNANFGSFLNSTNSKSTGINSNSNNNENKNLSAWYDLFAELDPLKNPDAIGQKEGLEEERNC